jgi:hypothetical protein
MKKKFGLLIAALAWGCSLFAQEETGQDGRKFDANRLVFGGVMGASFGDFTFVQVSPQVGYAFNQYLTAGGGVNFIYSSDKFGGTTSQYGYAGLNVFGRIFPVKFLVLTVQPELNYNWGKVKYDIPGVPDQTLDGKFIPSLLLGGGVVIPTGGRGNMLLTLQYDVLQNNRSPYGRNAFVNFGFTF